MIGSLDCTHINWTMCPVAHHGQYVGKEKKATIILEATACKKRRFWHYHFGTPGSCNDLNVLQKSDLLNTFNREYVGKHEYKLSDKTYKTPYLLTDGIYPRFSIFMKPLSSPCNVKQKVYTKRHESVRKDIECAFGILKKKFTILAHGINLRDLDTIKNVVRTCVVLHNVSIMFNNNEPVLHMIEFPNKYCRSNNAQVITPTASWSRNDDYIRSKDTHLMIRNNLIDSVWTSAGNSASNDEFIK